MINDVFDEKSAETGWLEKGNRMLWADPQIPAGYREALLQTCEEILGSEWFIDVVKLTAVMAIDSVADDWDAGKVGEKTLATTITVGGERYVRGKDVLRFLRRAAMEIENE